MTPDEMKVEQLLRSLGLTPERFGEDQQLAHGEPSKGEKGKTPDFRVRTMASGLFFCEVVSIVHDEGAQYIPHNKLADKIHKAVRQFDAVNSARLAPNVVVWICHQVFMAPDSLLIPLMGKVPMGDGTWCTGFERYSEGRIKDEKRRVDAHIWVDAHDKAHFLFFQDPQRPEHMLSLYGCLREFARPGDNIVAFMHCTPTAASIAAKLEAQQRQARQQGSGFCEGQARQDVIGNRC
jgi:hypothetical protein